MADLPVRHSRDGTSSSNAVAPVRHSLEGGNPQALITEHLDIWTSAIKSKSTAGRGSSNKLELVGIKKLRELILELAVRGKLVPQDPNDEPASKILERISAEQAKLLKEKKIKQSKFLADIHDGEVIFKAPNGWAWSRMGDLAQYQKGYAFKSKDYLSSGFMITKIQNLTENHAQNAAYISPEKSSEFEQYLLFKGDIVMTTVGSWFSAPDSAVGRSFLINKIFDNSLLNQNAVRIRPWEDLNPKYLHICVNSLIFKNYLVQEAQGTANQASITQVSIKNFSICVPPKAEQHRIVAKVDELMALCDQLEAQTESSIQAHQVLVETLLATLSNAKNADELSENWQTISQHFDLLFTTQDAISQLKQTILQLAVMGKLVKQNPNDEPAAKLLERISTEKQQLIKDGKIKKQKPLPPIADEEKPFELPVGWEWVYLNNLLPQFQNGASSRGDKNGKDVVVLRLADIKSWKISLNDTRTLAIAEETIKRYSLQNGDVLIIRVNGSADIVGRFITCESDLDAIYCDHFIRMNFPIKCIFTPYLFLLGSSELIRSRIANLFVSTAGQKTVNQTHIGSLPISLPPFAEQERIVKKVEKIMTLCDSLKTKLNQAQTTQLHLTDAIVEQVVEKEAS